MRTYRTWQLPLEETLTQVAERHDIPFPIFVDNISPFWLSKLAQVEGNWDDQQMQFYQEAIKEATVSEFSAYLTSAGLNAVYKGPIQLIKRMVLIKARTCLFSFLVFARNQRNWHSSTPWTQGDPCN